MRLRDALLLLAIMSSAVGLAEVTGTRSANAAEPEPSKPLAAEIEVHATYGRGGSTRPPEVIAGEVLSLLFSLSNMGVTSENKIEILLQAELLDSTGGVMARAPVRPVSGVFGIESRRVIQFLDWLMPPDLPPGTYRIRTRAFDANDVQLAEYSLPLRVKPIGTFGAANIRLTHDEAGNQPATGVFAEGTELDVHFLLVGLDTSQDRVLVELKTMAVDTAGKIDMVRPITRTIDRTILGDAAKTAPSVWFQMGLNKSGEFRIRLELDDKMAGKSASYEIPILVVPRP